MPITKEFAKSIVDEYWKQYDVDKSGVLNPEEASNYLRDLFSAQGISLNDKQLHVLFNALDVNKNGVITKDELIMLMLKYF